MKRKTRQEKLVDNVTQRLSVLEMKMLSPLGELTDAEYAEIEEEAIKLREVLKILQS